MSDYGKALGYQSDEYGLWLVSEDYDLNGVIATYEGTFKEVLDLIPTGMRIYKIPNPVFISNDKGEWWKTRPFSWNEVITEANKKGITADEWWPTGTVIRLEKKNEGYAFSQEVWEYVPNGSIRDSEYTYYTKKTIGWTP